MTKNERRLFCVRNHDDNHCLINNNKCKKACRRMDLDMNSVREEEEYQKKEMLTGVPELDNLLKSGMKSDSFLQFYGQPDGRRHRFPRPEESEKK